MEQQGAGAALAVLITPPAFPWAVSLLQHRGGGSCGAELGELLPQRGFILPFHAL